MRTGHSSSVDSVDGVWTTWKLSGTAECAGESRLGERGRQRGECGTFGCPRLRKRRCWCVMRGSLESRQTTVECFTVGRSAGMAEWSDVDNTNSADRQRQTLLGLPQTHVLLLPKSG